MRRRHAGPLRRVSLFACVALCLTACGDLNVSRSSKPRSAAATGVPVAQPNPRIEVIEPARGAFLSPGRVAVRGRVLAVSPDAPVSAVEIDGQQVPVAVDGTFSGSTVLAAGVNVISLSCTDATGRPGSANVGVLAGRFAPINQPIPHAVGLRLNDAALNAFGKIIERVIWATDLTAALSKGGPLYETNLLWIEIWASVTQVRFQDVWVQLDADPQGLRVRAEIQDLVVDVDVEASFGLGSRVGPAPAQLHADSVVLETRLRLDPKPDGRVGASIRNPTLDLVNFQASSTSQLIQVALPLVRKAVENAIRNGIVDLLQNEAQPALERSLAEGLQPDPFEVLDHRYAYDLRLEQAHYDDNGMSFVFRFNAPPVAPTGVDRGAPGSLVTAATMPDLHTIRGVKAVIDDDTLNRALYGAWAGGVFDYTIDEAFMQRIGAAPDLLPLRLGALTRFVPELAAVAGPDAPLRMRVKPKLPPVIEITGVPDLVEASACEVEIAIDVERGNGWETLLESAVHMRAGATLELSARGFAMRMASLPDIRVDILEEPLVELDDRKIQVMLGLVLTPAIPQLLNGTNVLPIPHVDQLSVFNVFTRAGGPNREHLVVEADLQR